MELRIAMDSRTNSKKTTKGDIGAKKTVSRSSKRIVIASAISTIVTCLLLVGIVTAITTHDRESAQQQMQQQIQEEQDRIASEEQQALQAAVDEARRTYPTGWLIAPEQGVPAETPVQIFYLPGYSITVHKDGLPADANVTTLPTDPNKAKIVYNDYSYDVDPDNLLVNLPNLLPNAIYDIQYSYSAPSNAGGHDIDDLTGKALVGYSGKASDPYLARDEYVVPCQYSVAMKLIEADRILWDDYSYRLVIWDIYRPKSASVQISDAFSAAYESDGAIREATDGWGLDWYAASEVSGHNLGCDVDVAVANADGKLLPLPSGFDSFDATGHLTVSQMGSTDIKEDSYTQAVLDSPGCMALHKAMQAAGFSELASEWWHFSDKDTEQIIKERYASDGLDFIPTLG